ncbi:MAG: class I SAM-dependent methyltransferase [Eubacteriaceae bacterium]|nr:class I SAM-dependent methyltransferase [Eubacteriaceae bacterium]
MKNTVEYYDRNAESFFSGTVNADMSDQYSRFEKYLPLGASILDAGCGSGRDSRHFMNIGFAVSAFDASDEMVKLSSDFTGLEVKKATFDDFDFNKEFDGIWTCASLLHVRRESLKTVIGRLASHLKDNGVMYMSFKYGTAEYVKDGRYFNCYDEDGIRKLLGSISYLSILDIYQSLDARKDRKDEYWLNVIVRKTSDQ